jgi:4-hydroxy-tetrahydrodipicolinate synthase
MLDDATARQVASDWRSALNDRVVIAGVGSRQAATPQRATADSIAMGERAAAFGADALLVYAPTWLRGHERSEEMIIEHHRRLAEIGLPLVLFYLYEEAGGISYSASVLDELLSMPRVLGIKMATLDSVMTFQDISRQLSATQPGKLLITGEDRFLGYSLMRGARAALIGMGAVCCEIQADLIKALNDGDADRFLRLSDRVDTLAESLFIAPMEGYIRRVLWALAHLGVIPLEAANDPWGPPLSRKEFEQIGATLTELQLASGMAGR